MKSSPKTIIYFIAFFSYCYAERLKLKQADVLESKRIGFETVKILEGNIEFQKGNIELKCQNSIYKEKKDIAYLYDNVKMNKEDINLTCDSIIFFSKNNKLESTGNPIIEDTEYRLTANKLMYFTDLDSGIAVGNVELLQNNQRIKADKIEYRKKSNAVSYLATGNVKIIDSLRTATCGLASYKPLLSKILASAFCDSA